MTHKPTRLFAAIALATIAFAPFTASAQIYSGTNGKLVYLNAGGDLLSANPDGQGVTTLATSAQLGSPGSNISINKAETKIVYANTTQSGLVTAGINGSSPTPLTSTAGDNNPVWSPDGTKVYFDNNFQDILSVNADGTGRTTLVTHSSTLSYFGPSISPDGTTLAFTVSSSTTNILDVESSTSTGTSVVNLTNNPTGTNSSYPDFSPDGTKLVFHQTTSAASNVATMSVAGGTVTVVATTPSGSCTGKSYFGDSFSPDNTKITFLSQNNTCSGGGGYSTATPNVISADGTGLTVLTSLGNISAPQWSGLVLAAETTPTPVPSLPAAGALKTSAPIALGLIGLFAAAGIETTRRLRRQA